MNPTTDPTSNDTPINPNNQLPVEPTQPVPVPETSQPAPVSTSPAAPTPTVEPQPVVASPQVITPSAPTPVVSSQFFTPDGPNVPVVGGVQIGGPGPKKSSKKKLWLFSGLGAALVLLIVGFVFFWYIPNTPNGAYRLAMSRTGKAVNGVVNNATDAKTVDAFKTAQVSGNLSATSDGQTINGTIHSKFDQTNSDVDLKVSVKDQSGATKTVNASLLSQQPSGSIYPNIYFKVDGLSGLGLDDYLGSLSSYEGKWISISSDYLKTLVSQYSADTSTKNTKLTAKDATDAAKSLTNVTTEYVFTNKPDKSIFVKKSYVGKEKIDGFNTYHYKVAINQTNAKKYCVALVNTFYATNAYKNVSGQTAAEISKSKQSAVKNCNQDSSKDNKTYDMWVDGKYKLIYKFRVYDENSKTAYTDFGQQYKGGDELALFARHYDTSAGSVYAATIGTNFKTNVSTALFTYKAHESNVKLSLTLKPATGSSKVAAPANSVPLQQILQQLGINPSADVSEAKDTKRQVDISALQTQLEAFYAANNYYPTLANLNSVSWRSANMASLDPTALQDPNGSSQTLGTSASATQYGYAATGCSADHCTGYTLSALLSSGTAYTKNNLD